MKDVLCDELIAFAVAYGFEVLDCKTLFPPQIDDFVASARIGVDILIRRNNKTYYFGDFVCVHPAVSMDQFMSSEIWRYTLLEPVKRQIWEVVTHED